MNTGNLRCSPRYAQKYARVAPEKDWNFPKAHTHKHAFSDIQNKGVSKNYNTKPNEKMHGALKTTYQCRTNFRDVAPQVCSL